jgi:hypothetical protein
VGVVEELDCFPVVDVVDDGATLVVDEGEREVERADELHAAANIATSASIVTHRRNETALT